MSKVVLRGKLIVLNVKKKLNYTNEGKLYLNSRIQRNNKTHAKKTGDINLRREKQRLPDYEIEKNS